MATSLLNPAYIPDNPGYDPTLIGDTQANAQQLALANALMQGGLSPIQNQSMGAIPGRLSGYQGMAKIAQLLSGQNMQQSANAQANDLARRQGLAMAGMFGMGQQQAPQPSSGSAAMGMGATQGSVGPTVANAQLQNSMAPAQPSPSPVGPMSVAGASPATNMMDYMTDPAAHMKAVMDQYAQTPEMKMAAAAFGVGTPGYMQALAAQVRKAGYITPAQVRQGNLALDGNNQPIAYNPKTSDGVQPTFGTSNGFTSATGSAPVPNYLKTSSDLEFAQALGKSGGTSQNTMTTVNRPDGTTQNMTQAQAVAYANGQSQPGAYRFTVAQGAGEAARMRSQIAQSGDMGALGAYDAVQARGGMPGFTSGQSTTDQLLQKNAADVLSSAPQLITQSKSANAGLQTALGIVEGGLKTGQGTGGTMDALALVNNLGIPLEKGDVNGYQTVKKLLQNSLNTAAAGTGASGSDARFESFSLGQPDNGKMNAVPLAGAIRYVMSQNDAAIARASFLPQAAQQAKAAGATNPVQAAQEAWAQKYEPQYFQFNRMSPTDQAAYLTSLKTPEARHAFVQSYNQYAQQTGWVH